MRQFEDIEGNAWEAVAMIRTVAHRKEGRALGFRPAAAEGDAQAEVLETNITFNGERAAENAIRTMSEKELRRRLRLASEAGGVRRQPLL